MNSPPLPIRTTNQRLVAFCAGALLVFGLLWARCAWLQVLGAGRLEKLARAQHQIAYPLLAQRGTIYDAQGRVLAFSARMSSVFANPRQVAVKREAAARLAGATGRDLRVIAARLNRDKGFVWIARKVEPEVTGRVAQLRTAGVGVVEEPQRIYPQGALASHLLGFADIDQKGLEGLELAFNGVLQGRSGWLSTLRDAKGDQLIGPWTVQTSPQPGLEMVLTIDSVVQEVAEEALAWGVKRFRAKGGSVIIMEPHTGRILAMANHPEFDPNHPAHAAVDARRNRAVTDLAEPGSVFKIVTASALLEEGLATPEERVFCEYGNYKTVGRHVLHDHRPHGWLTFHEVIQFSSNIGTAKLASRLSPETLDRYIRAFGFGRKTGIECPGEVRGIVPPPSKWSKLSPYSIPIGQEVAVTPIQMAVMTAAIANGGWRVQPTIVDRIQTADGEVVRTSQAHAPERILSRETTDRVERMLVDVVGSGTGQLANVQGLIVAGKTGTAQKLEPTGRYSHSLFVASFVGYGPVPDPKFVMVVSIDEPRPLYFGGVVAAPIFSRVVKGLTGYWDLKPSVEPALIARLPS